MPIYFPLFIFVIDKSDNFSENVFQIIRFLWNKRILNLNIFYLFIFVRDIKD